MRKHSAIWCLGLSACLLAASGARAIDITLRYAGIGSPNQHPDAAFRSDDPSGEALMTHTAQAAAEWEAVILDNHAMTIDVYYVNPSGTSGGTANAVVDTDIKLASKATRTVSGRMVVSNQFSFYIDPDPTNDTEFQSFVRRTADTLSPAQLNDYFTIDTELVPALEISHRAVGPFDVTKADLLTIVRHELGHFVGLNQFSRDEGDDGDYDVPSNLAGINNLEINGLGHFEANGPLMAGRNIAPPNGMRSNITATDVLAAATGSEWTNLDLPRVDFARVAANNPQFEFTFGNPVSWVGGSVPNSGDEVFIRNGSRVQSGDPLVRIDALTIANGSELRVGSGTFVIEETAVVGGSSPTDTARVTIDSGALFSSHELTVQPGGLFLLRGGELRSQDLLNNNSSLVGNGLISVVRMENEGLSTIQPLNGTLTVGGPTIASPFFDLGTSQSFLDARNGSLVVSIPHSDLFNGRIEVGAGQSVTLHNAWVFGGSNPILLSGSAVAEATLGGAKLTLRRQLTVNRRARLDTDVEATSMGNLSVPDANDSLHITGDLGLNTFADMTGQGEARVDGTLTISSPGAGIDISALTIGEGAQMSAGTVEVTSIRIEDPFVQNGGTLHVTNFDGTLLQNGGHLVGDDLTIDGNYGLGRSATLVLNGLDTLPEDGLVITGNAELGGRLEFTIDGVIPDAGERITALTADSLQVEGLRLSGPDADFFEWLVIDDSLVLQSLGQIAGDYNRDGIVDAADYTVWRDQLHQTGPDLAADGDGDGEVERDDYLIWVSGYGDGAQAFSVPEPVAASSLFVAIGCHLIFSTRQRCRG